MTDKQQEDFLQKVAELERDKEQASGALAELLRQTKEEFGYESVEEIEEAIAKLKRKHERVAQERDEEYERLAKKWKDKL